MSFISRSLANPTELIPVPDYIQERVDFAEASALKQIQAEAQWKLDHPGESLTRTVYKDGLTSDDWFGV